MYFKKHTDIRQGYVDLVMDYIRKQAYCNTIKHLKYVHIIKLHVKVLHNDGLTDRCLRVHPAPFAGR